MLSTLKRLAVLSETKVQLTRFPSVDIFTKQVDYFSKPVSLSSLCRYSVGEMPNRCLKLLLK